MTGDDQAVRRVDGDAMLPIVPLDQRVAPLDVSEALKVGNAFNVATDGLHEERQQRHTIRL